MASMKNLLFTIITVGFRQVSRKSCGVSRADGSVSCIVFVASSMGFIFPILEILESVDKKSFELYFMLKYCIGLICLFSSVAWLYLFHRSRTQPEAYLDGSTSVVDPAANIIYILLLILSIGIILSQGLSVILDMTCYRRFVDYHYLCSSINRMLEMLFCVVQTLVLMIMTRSKFQNKLRVNYVLSTALLTNGILWMFTSLEIGRNQNSNMKNETLEAKACYNESKIYQNILLHTWTISAQTHLNYFLLCVGLTASTLPFRIGFTATKEEEDVYTSGSSDGDKEKQQHKKMILKENKVPEYIVAFISLVSFLPTLLVVILQEWTHPPDLGASVYLREWYLSAATCPMFFLLIAVYKGLHCIKGCPIRARTKSHPSFMQWIFKNDAIFILCLMGDVSRCTLTWVRELDKPFLLLGICLRLCYIIQSYVQTIFLLTAERIAAESYKKIKYIALFLCVGNLVLWVYRECLVIFTEHPSEFELIIFSLSSMNRFLSFVRSYRLYSLSKCTY